MIDTIKIRLHGILDVKDDTLSIIQSKNGRSNFLVPEHQEIYKKLLKFRNKNYNMNLIYNKETNSVETLTDDEFLLIENSKKLTHYYQNRNMMRFVNSKETKEINLRVNGNYRVPSSSSDINFSINENASYIDFEFSIPKYLYGHNLAQFIPQSESSAFFRNGLKPNLWAWQSSKLYKRLLNFIENRFFVDMMYFFELDVFPNMHYVEIRRIDLCYNQFFETKQDALTYLENQKKLKKEKNYITKKSSSNFGTTLTLNSSFGSYFKIYHKGSEYSSTKGDLNKHMKINRDYLDHLLRVQNAKGIPNIDWDKLKSNKDLIFETLSRYAKEQPLNLNEDKKHEIRPIIKKIKSKLPYDVVFLKDEMDKVLRYEVSLYGDFFQYLYKRKVFRRKDKIHLQMMNLHSRVKTSLDTRVVSKQKVFKEDLKQYKIMNAWLNRKVNLVLSRNGYLKRFERISAKDYNSLYETYNISSNHYKKTILQNKDVGIFSDYFLKLCIRHFRQLIIKHQIKKMSTFEDIASKIANYNEETQKRIDQYNKVHHFLTLDPFGKQRIRGTRVITKATQLLTQKQQREKKLKKVNANLLLFLVNQLVQGISLEQYRVKAKLNPATIYRYKKDLELFGVFENTLQTEKEITPDIDFKKYYWLTKGLNYSSKFFLNQDHKKIS